MLKDCSNPMHVSIFISVSAIFCTRCLTDNLIWNLLPETNEFIMVGEVSKGAPSPYTAPLSLIHVPGFLGIFILFIAF
jgi:hypothetical protein